MKYPMIANWLEVRRKSKTECEIYDVLSEETVTMPYKVAKRLKMLDGETDPAEIYPDFSEDELVFLLMRYEDYGYIRKSRFVLKEFPILMYTLFFPKITKVTRMLCKILNLLLLITWSVILIVGIRHYYYDEGLLYFYPRHETLQIVFGIIFGMICGSIFHECGHALSGIAYGADICEMGVMLHFILPGAYVMLNDKKVRGRFAKIQIMAAGVEMNAFMTGINLLLTTAFTNRLCIFFFEIALINFGMLIVNMMLTGFLDGAKIFELAFGVKNKDGIFETVEKITSIPYYYYQMKEKGIDGIATIIFCYIISSFKILMPILMIVEVISLISWIFFS